MVTKKTEEDINKDYEDLNKKITEMHLVKHTIHSYEKLQLELLNKICFLLENILLCQKGEKL